ncbi:MAG: SDR family oxidoreductase [Actinobacteria bacterium]|nr:SDR family oxidoreductase [Actinomycetota bacterium]
MPIAVITGGGGVLRDASAKALASRGYDVVVTGRTAATLDASVAAVEELGRRGLAVPGDVSGEAHVDAVFAAAAELGPVEAVLHAAATHGTPMRLVDVPLEEREHVIATNMRSTFLVTRAALRQMVPRRRGAIVLVASAGILRGFPLAAPYAATKSSLVGFARTLAAEVSPDGVRVNVLTPGAMPEAAIYRSAMPGIAKELGIDPEKGKELLESMSALRRACTPEEMARAVVYLATDDSSLMTGQNLVVDAGLTT